MATIDFDPEDYIDEIDADDLIEELKKRHILPKSFTRPISSDEKFDASLMCSRTPKRDTLISFLGLHKSATLEDMQNEIEQIYNK
jgi:hypothetical protein